MSSKHAEIQQRLDGRFEIVNHSATNGTYVKGSRVSVAVLVDGDEIQMGSTLFRFEGESVGFVASPSSDDAPGVDAGGGPRLRTIPIDSVVMKHTAMPALSLRQELAGATRFAAEREIHSDAAIRRGYEKLRVSQRLGSEVGEREVSADVLARIASVVVESLATERVCVLVVDPKTGRPAPRLACACFESASLSSGGDRMVLSSTLISTVIASRAAVLYERVEAEPQVGSSRTPAPHDTRSILCVPLMSGEAVVGVLYTDVASSTQAYGEAQLGVLAAIAVQAGVLVTSAMQHEELRHNERRRADAFRELLAGASRGISNPLAVIRSNMSVLSSWAEQISAFHRQIPGCASLEDVAALAEDNSIDFIDTELKMMSVESSSASFRIAEIADAMRFYEPCGEVSEEVDVRELLSQVIESVRSQIEEVGVLRHALHDGARVRGSHDRLLRLFSSLMDNAFQSLVAGAAEQCVEVRARRCENILMVTIDDTGCGLPVGPEDQIFRPFFTTRQDGALGLGLTVAEEIAYQHGGSIQVGRRHRGTHVEVRLPLER